MRTLVLVGSGHAHVEVIRRWAKSTIDNVRLIVVSPNVRTPYSGMIPGTIAGIYSEDEAYIALEPLCYAAGARFICHSVVHVDRDNRRVRLDDGNYIHYDLLSINCGITPDLSRIEANDGSITPVKPIDVFLQQWQLRKTQLAEATQPITVTIVGGGAASCEIVSSLKWQIDTISPANKIRWQVVAPKGILPEYQQGARRRVIDHFEQQGIKTIPHFVTTAHNRLIVLDNGQTLDSDWAIWALPGVGAPFLTQSGLCDNGLGDIPVNQALQHVSDNHIFAAGDCISFAPQRLRKTGVYPVRQAPVLDKNLRQVLRGRSRLSAFKPRQTLLNILLLNPHEAILSFGRLHARGAWVLRLKDLIDRRFMRRYRL